MGSEFVIPFILYMILGSHLGLAEEPSAYQSRDSDYPSDYQEYPLIILNVRSNTTEVRYLRYEKADLLNHTVDIQKDKFDTIAVPAGKELTIRGYWVSKSLIEAYQAKMNGKKEAFFKGADSPGYDEILAAFRGSNVKSFVEMLGKLAELRRSAESDAELKEVQNALDPKDAQGLREFVEQIAFGTGMVEVEDPAATGPGARNRRFIPLDLLRTGAIEINSRGARIKVLKSLVVAILSQDLPLIQANDRETARKEKGLRTVLRQTASEIGCASFCATESSTFSETVENVLKIGLTDNSTRFDIMDSRYQEKLNQAEFQKLSAIMTELRKQCLP